MSAPGRGPYGPRPKRPGSAQEQQPGAPRNADGRFSGSSQARLQLVPNEARLDKLDAWDRALLRECEAPRDVEELDENDLRRAFWLVSSRLLVIDVSFDDRVTLQSTFAARDVW